MASSRQIQVMKLRVMEKLDDIFSQQKTIIATINSMSSQVKKKADRLLKSVNNEVTVSDFVNVLQDLERCFNNLIAIAITTDDLFTLNTSRSNSLFQCKNALAQDSLSDYQTKWSNQEISEFHSQNDTSYNLSQPNVGSSFNRYSPEVQSNPCDSQNYSADSWTGNQYLSGCNDSVSYCSSPKVTLCDQMDPQVSTVFSTGQMESVPQQKWATLNSDSDLETISSQASPVKDIASIENIASVPAFCPRNITIEEPYGLGPELKYQKVVSVMNVQVCETVTPYCFWVQMSSFVHLLQELASEIRLFINSSKYNPNAEYGITCPVVGMTCIAPFTDGSYYRARVLSIVETQNPDNPIESQVNVLYVDYGNMDIIPVSHLIKMPQSLAKFPTQAICCSLSKVTPDEINEDWSSCSSEAFHNMVYCKNLVCNPVYSDNFIPQIVDLYLLELASPITLKDLKNRRDSKVSSILIKQGFARHITESEQIRKIYQIIKNCVLFKSDSSSQAEVHRLVAQRNSPISSTSTIGLPQSSDSFELHHQNFQVGEESNSLDFQDPVSAQMMVTSSHGAQLGASSVSCSKVSMPNYNTAENDLSNLSDLISDQNLSHDSAEFSRQENAHKEVDDLKNSSNSHAVVSKSDNCTLTSIVKTVTTSRVNDSGSKENFNSDGLLPTITQQNIPAIPEKNSLSPDLESTDPKSDSDGFRAVMISHVESPSSFYVHHIAKETSLQLEKLVQELNSDFHSLTPGHLKMLSSDFVIENGKLCCAYNGDEQTYYRGLIIEHKTDSSEGILVKVFYVDFGNSDWLCCDKIYPLPLRYSKIPVLAWHCGLAYVQPQGPVWPDEAKVAFKNMIQVKETYFIRIVAGSSTLDLPSLGNYQKSPMEVLMTNCDGSVSNGFDQEENETTEICLNYELIDLKHAYLDVDNSENTDTIEWDPMSEDFDSRRNCYDMNVDDAEIAAVGFKVKDEVKICKFFRDGRKCWLGERCPYKHIRLAKDCLTADKREAICDVGLLGQIELPLVGSLIGVEVSAVSNPVQFYVILPWGIESIKNLNSLPVGLNKEETLPDLQESLQEYYQKLPLRAEENLLWTIGELGVAKAPADEQWYRALISEVIDSSNFVKVFFVDYGNVQWIPEKNIQPIQPEFVHLPHQAIECCLDGIASASTNGLWTQESRDYFLELVDDVVLVAHVNSIISKRLYIDLYDTSKEKDQNIAEELVKVGIARRLTSNKSKPSTKPPINLTDQPESSNNVFFTPG